MEKIIIGNFREVTKKDKKRLTERRDLAKALRENNIPHEVVNSEWPKDCFVYNNGSIYTRKENGFYADGGYIIPGNGLTFACSSVSEIDGKLVNSPEERIRKLESLYGKTCILPPPNNRLNEYISPHIDLVLLPIPGENSIFIDSTYLEENFKEISQIRTKYNLNFIPVFNDYSRPEWPCNTPILIVNNRKIAIINKNCPPKFKEQLSKFGINLILVPFSENCSVGGGIACATNKIPNNYNGLEKILF